MSFLINVLIVLLIYGFLFIPMRFITNIIVKKKFTYDKNNR